MTRLIVEDRVPFGPIRDRLDERGGYLAELVSCAWCSSVWLAVGVVIVRRYRWWRPVALALAFSEVAGLTSSYTER